MSESINISIADKGISFCYSKGNVNVFDEMQMHSHYEIYFLKNGSAVFESRSIKEELKPNTLVLIRQGEYHNFKVSGDVDEYERFVLNLHPAFAESDCIKKAFGSRDIILLESGHRIEQNFLYLKECSVKLEREDFKEVLFAVCTDVFYQIKNVNGGTRTSGVQRSPLAEAIMDYINEHYTERISLAEMSSMLNYSVSHISHVFGEEYGISVKKYILQKRLNSAQLMILAGEKAGVACEKSGFANYSDFFRAYKNVFGTSPKNAAR